MWVCVVLPLKGFGAANLLQICSWFLLFANGARTGIIAGVVVIYMAIKKNSINGLAYCSAIMAYFLLKFKK